MNARVGFIIDQRLPGLNWKTCRRIGVRALWAGQPFIWHIYPQDDNAHHAKLDAFLDWLEAPQSLRQFHRVWNGVAAGVLPPLDSTTLTQWAACSVAARRRLLVQDDLLRQLLRLALK